ncbi:MAG: hypothetical protein IJ083_13445 [Clostridia bacterium]|nr:hypothetical protein [Clostridia bacterium]
MRRSFVVIFLILGLGLIVWISLVAFRVLPIFPVSSPSTADEDMLRAEDIGLLLCDTAEGVSVLAVQAGSLAENMGVEPGDLVISLKGTSLSSAVQADTALLESAPLSMTLVRNGHRIEKQVSLPAHR